MVSVRGCYVARSIFCLYFVITVGLAPHWLFLEPLDLESLHGMFWGNRAPDKKDSPLESWEESTIDHRDVGLTYIESESQINRYDRTRTSAPRSEK